MVWHAKKSSEVIKELKSNSQTGLSSSEVENRIKEYGLNELKSKRKSNILLKFANQFKDVMVIILIVAAIISFFIAIKSKESTDYIEPIVILIIVFMNATLGVIQESKAEKAMEALKKMSATHVSVLRDGKKIVIETNQLVPGDIVYLETGDYVGADGRLLEVNSLKIEEASLTGESFPVEKNINLYVPENAPIAERTNMCFSGCSVVAGSGKMIVVNTGMRTEIGQVANLLNEQGNSLTPLQKKLDNLGKFLGVMAISICAIIFSIGLFEKMKPLEIFMISISLAVAAIPEGLPAIVTIIFAIGVQRMAKRNAIIRKLPAVETLGSASVICSDKTGTLTQNKMTLVEVYTSKEIEKLSHQMTNQSKNLLIYASLCCNATDNLGDPTEVAIVKGIKEAGISLEKKKEEYPRVGEIPFDSDRKLMTTIHKNNGKYLVIVKGAYEQLVTKCKQVNKNYYDKYLQMSREGNRVLAIAIKEIEYLPTLKAEMVEKELNFLGLIAMIDPPREEVIGALKECKKAGIKTVMITGDNVITATAIAKKIGIATNDSQVITGTELSKLTDDQLNKRVRNIKVYARVTPKDKLRIVKAWQNQNEVVAMTGDGVNDAPALKAADIGCSMGIMGTEVAKRASDMILTDDNFSTIVESVKEGRCIYDNIRKTIEFLLGTNMGEIFTMLFAMLFWKETPLLSMQLLWVNLVTDTLPALALGVEKQEEDIMEKDPKPKDEDIFAGGLIKKIGLQGLMFSFLTLLAFYIGKENMSLQAGQTMAFITLSSTQIFQAYNMRSTHSLFRVGWFSNKYMVGASIVSFALIGIILFIPAIAVVFEFAMMPTKYYVISLLLAFLPIIFVEIIKKVRN